MIALLAAVPEETRLIRQSIDGLECREVAGLKLWQGVSHGVAVCLAHSGISKAAAATAATTLALSCRPDSLWSFGCGGAYPQSGLAIGDLALAEQEIFGDEGVMSTNGFSDLAETGLPMLKVGAEAFFNAWPVDEQLFSWAKSRLSGVTDRHDCTLRSGPFVTVSTCTGTTVHAEALAKRTGGLCENMEGAAVALACHQHRLPLLEVRGISNLVEDRDPGRWDLSAGMNIAQKAILALLEGSAQRR